MIIPKTETLESQIVKARELLSEDSRRAIDAVNWKQILLGMSKKYNVEQQETLETETSLLLCGITSTINFPKELETRMMLPKNEVALLLVEMDKLIFKKMEEELKKILTEKTNEITNSSFVKPSILDPKFSSIPLDVQNAIAMSDWKNKLYDIAKKYNLAIDKMGLLEEITIQTIRGDIHIEQYENKIKSKTELPEEKIKDFISEINEAIFKNIKNTMVRGDFNKININNLPSKEEKGIPLPPYKIITNDQLPITNNKIEKIINNYELGIRNDADAIPLPPIDKTENVSKKDADIYKESGIEIMSDNIETEAKKEVPQINDIKNDKEEEVIKNIKASAPLNIISNKLFNKTSSQTTVADYSLPKITNDSTPPSNTQSSPSVNPHDPYHETI